MFACIYILDFPVEAIVRSEPLLREQAVAVLEGKPPLARVAGLNDKARALGMEMGMSKLKATVFAASGNGPSRSAPAILRQRSPQQEAAAHAALLDVAHAFTPRVEDSAPDTLLLDLAGLDRLYGSSAKMARELSSRVSAVGVEPNIALAANPDAALHAARGFSGVTVIPPGKEAQRLGMLPLQVLLDGLEISAPGPAASALEAPKLREQMLDTLERWGVRDFRTLALLPDHALASRLGEMGTRLQRMARGAGLRTLALCQPSSHFEEVMELECAVENLEPLSFILNRLLEQLCARLEARALAVEELRLQLQRERWAADEESASADELALAAANTSLFERVLRLPVAMRDARVFLKLLQLELVAHPPGAPVTKVWISAEPAPPRSAQRGLFLPVTPEAERLEITLARISGVVGERRAGIARVLDTNRPDGFCMQRFTAQEAKDLAAPTLSDTGERSRLALRRLRPAWQLRVSVAEGRPVSLSAAAKPNARTELHGKVLWSAGPWRSSGDWWTENAHQEHRGPWDREEWDIALANDAGVALYRIYRNLANGQWFADASYD